MNRSDLHKQQPMEKPSAGAGASAPGGGDGELRDNKHEKKRRKGKKREKGQRIPGRISGRQNLSPVPRREARCKWIVNRILQILERIGSRMPRQFAARIFSTSAGSGMERIAPFLVVTR